MNVGSIDLMTAAIFFAGASVGAWLGWFSRARTQARAGRPMLALDRGDIVINNMLDEHLQLVGISATSPFALAFRTPNANGGEPDVEHWFRRSRSYSQTIPSKREARLQLLLREHGRPNTVWLTFSSANKTLTRERVRIIVPA